MILLDCALDDLASIQAPRSGVGGTTVGAIDFVPAVVNKGLRVNAADEYAKFQQLGNFVPALGTLEFWFRSPDGSHVNTKRELFGSGPWNAAGTMHLVKHGKPNAYAFDVITLDADGARYDARVQGTDYVWFPGVWVRLKITWDWTTATVRVWMDGVERSVAFNPMPPPPVPPIIMPPPSDAVFLAIGARPGTQSFANGVFDELVIHDAVI